MKVCTSPGSGTATRCGCGAEVQEPTGLRSVRRVAPRVVATTARAPLPRGMPEPPPYRRRSEPARGLARSCVGTRIPPHESGRPDPRDRVTLSSAPRVGNITGDGGRSRGQHSCEEIRLRPSRLSRPPCTYPGERSASRGVGATRNSTTLRRRCRTVRFRTGASWRGHRIRMRPSRGRYAKAAAAPLFIRALAVIHGLRRSIRLRA